MRNLKSTFAIVVLLFAQAGQAATQYETDPQNFYVDGQSINQALSTVNNIICYIGAMRPDAFVNDGAYAATIYEEDCETGAADASSEQSSATATSSSSSSTASSTTTTTGEGKTANTAVLQVSRLNSIAPVRALAWVSAPAQSTDDPYDVDMKIYADVKQTGGVTDTSPNGDFEMNFSTHVDGATEYFRDGQWMGEGYIQASGGSLKFKEFGNGQENDIAAVFLANGDKRGVYKEFAGFLNWDFEAQGRPYWDEPGWWESATDEEREEANSYYVQVQAIYQFYLSAADKGYCRRLSKANRMQWPTQEQIMEREQAEFAKEEAAQSAGTTYEIDWDSIHAPVLTPVYQVDDAGAEIVNETTGAYAEAGLVVGEECFTVDRSKAQRNVHRYGVYNADGGRLANNNPGFPMLAEVTRTLDDGTEVPERVHAWADYWGVHVDPRGRPLITADTVFEKETHGFVESSDTVRQQYKLRSTDIRIEKRTTSYLALNDIDGISLAFWAGDDWWSTEFRNLLGDKASYLDQFQEFEGSYDSATATFTFTDGINFDGGYQKKTLTDADVGLENITFTTTEWQDAMFKEWGVTTQNNEDGTTTKIKEDWYHKEVRNLGVWSHDTRQWYEITAEAMDAPTSAVKSAGIRTETTEFVSPGDVTETLYCLRECLDGSKVPTTFEDALSENYDEYGYVTSPYFDIGEYLKEDITMTKVERGFWNFAEAAEDFASTIGTNTDTRVLLGRQMAIADYVNGDPSLPLYSRADGHQDSGEVSSDGKTGDGKLRFYSWDGFSKNNLNKLLSKPSDPSDYGVVPSVHLDLREIPEAGSSGVIKMVVTVVEGNNSSLDSGERAVSSEANLNWSSDGSTFTVTVPETASTTMTLVTRDNTAIQGTYGNSNAESYGYAGGQIMTGTAGGAGITYKMWRIFSGHSGLSNLYDAGLGEFFETDREYTASVDISTVSGDSLTWSMDDRFEYSYIDENGNVQEESGGQINTVGLQKLQFKFRTYDDANVTREETYRKGEYREGLQLADMGSYTQSGGQMLDQNGVALGKGSVANAALAKLENPENQLRNARFKMPDNEWDSRSVSWGIRTGELAPASELANLECRKNGLAQEYDNHPVYGRSSDVKRYCSYKLWEDVNVKYNIMLETRPNYEVVYANAVDTDAVIGEVVEIDEPKTMYFEVPETVDANGDYLFGKDAGKRVRLEYNGHGNLWGIPGFVYDTATGEDLGEFVNNWKDTYRYISRFVMPDGSEIEDGVDSSIKYKVKALDGEEWLTPADGTITGVADLRGNYTTLYEGDETDLVKQRNLRSIGFEDWNGDGVNDNDRFIGDQPTPTVNNGETAVVHGEIIYDPTP
jgi:cytoskeletal protein RodZ